MQQDLIDQLPAVRRYAYSLTGSMADADDLLQSTVERVLKKPPPEDVAAAAWMFRICRNVWIDEHRARQTREKHSQDPVAQSESVESEGALDAHMALAEVDQAMNKLSDEQRELIGLVAVEGLSYKEIAATLAIPIGTVMSRIARARSALHTYLHASSGNAATGAL